MADRDKVSGRLLTIGKLAEQTGVGVETIRYYERAGVLPSPPRSAGGYRQYDSVYLKRLKFVKRSRELGFSLSEVRALLKLVDGGHTCAEVRELTLSHVEDIRAKILDLQHMERTLQATADRCTGGDAPECPIVEALSG